MPRASRDQLLARAQERHHARNWEGTDAVIRAIQQANAEEDGTSQPDVSDLGRMTDPELDRHRQDIVIRIADVHDATSPETGIRDRELIRRLRDERNAIMREQSRRRAAAQPTPDPAPESLTDAELVQTRALLMENLFPAGGPGPTGDDRARMIARRDAIIAEQIRRRTASDAAEPPAVEPDAPVVESNAEVLRQITDAELDHLRQGLTARWVDNQTPANRAELDAAIAEQARRVNARITAEDAARATPESAVIEAAPDVPPAPVNYPSGNDASAWSRWGDRAQEIADTPGPTLADLKEKLRRYNSDGNMRSSEELNAARAEMIAAVEQMYNGPNGTLGTGGATVEINSVSMSGFSGYILKDGERIGSFNRSITYRAGAPIEMHNGYMSIQPAHQGQGIAEDLYRRQENWAIREGIPKITIHANIDVGGYAWASKGYDFTSKAQARRMVNNLLSRSRYGGGGDHRTEFEAARVRLNEISRELERPGGRSPTAFELSQLGRENAWTDDRGRLMWPGKSMMLGTSWQAVKKLNPPRGGGRGRSARPNAAAGITTTANGKELRPGMQVYANGRRGRVTHVRPGTGVAIFRDEDGNQRSAQIRRMRTIPEVATPRAELTPDNLRDLPMARPEMLTPGQRVVTRLSATRGSVTSLARLNQRSSRARNNRIVNIHTDDGRDIIAYNSNTILEAEADRAAAPPPPPRPLQSGDIIRDTRTGRRGRISSIDARTGKIYYDEMRDREGNEYGGTYSADPTNIEREGDPAPPVTPAALPDANGLVPEHLRVGQHVQMRGMRQENGIVQEVYLDSSGRPMVRFTGPTGQRWDQPVAPGYTRVEAYTPPPARSTWEPSRDADSYSAWGYRAGAIANTNGINLRTAPYDLLASPESHTALRTALEDMYGSMGEGNLRMRITALDYRESSYGDGGRLSFAGSIRDADGVEVGTINRTVRYDDPTDPTRPTEIHNNFLQINRSVRGQGMAQDLYRRQENWAIQQGIDKITIHANIDVGGYAWASAGYDYQSRFDASSHLDHLIRGARAYSGDPEMDAALVQLRDYRARMDQDTTWFPTPWELSRIGHTPGAQTWPGKRLMLGSDWMAIKNLVPNNARDMSGARGVVDATPRTPPAPTRPQRPGPATSRRAAALAAEEESSIQQQLEEMARENGYPRSMYTARSLIESYRDQVMADLRADPTGDVTIGVPSMSEITIPNALVRRLLNLPPA